MDLNTKLQAFAALFEDQQRQRYQRDYASFKHAPEVTKQLEDRACQVTVKPGLKYTKVDIGGSGRYIVENSTETIYGIKAYGVPHKGHVFGTLDTIDQYDWSGYRAVKTGDIIT